MLLVDESHLALQLCGRKVPGAVSVDFGAAGMRYRRLAGHNELLGRAVGVGKKQTLSVIDATAGLGRDSFVLADLGAKVRLCERHPVVAALLAAGLASGGATADAWLNTVLARMSLVAGDVRELPQQELVATDVIYLDPMFPQRDKAAAVKKEMALFQFLLQDEPEDARGTTGLGPAATRGQSGRQAAGKVSAPGGPGALARDSWQGGTLRCACAFRPGLSACPNTLRKYHPFIIIASWSNRDV